MKQNLFFGSYDRSQSTFEASEFKADGLPSPQEITLLEPHRGELPPEVFGEPVTVPPGEAMGNNRKNLSEAVKLLAEAGWKRQEDRRSTRKAKSSSAKCWRMMTARSGFSRHGSRACGRSAWTRR
jgi:ABC-type oligopeptide transport system substrate-binding subunit